MVKPNDPPSLLTHCFHHVRPILPKLGDTNWEMLVLPFYLNFDSSPKYAIIYKQPNLFTYNFRLCAEMLQSAVSWRKWFRNSAVIPPHPPTLKHLHICKQIILDCWSAAAVSNISESVDWCELLNGLSRNNI